jgi:hypothetical protein
MERGGDIFTGRGKGKKSNVMAFRRSFFKYDIHTYIDGHE